MKFHLNELGLETTIVIEQDSWTRVYLDGQTMDELELVIRKAQRHRKAHKMSIRRGAANGESCWVMTPLGVPCLEKADRCIHRNTPEQNATRIIYNQEVGRHMFADGTELPRLPAPEAKAPGIPDAVEAGQEIRTLEDALNAGSGQIKLENDVPGPTLVPAPSKSSANGARSEHPVTIEAWEDDECEVD